MTAEERARAMIKRASTAELITQFELTEIVNNEHIPTVRGWLMDELESRDAEAYWRWVESDETSPRVFFEKKGA